MGGTNTHTRTRARTHARTHTQIQMCLYDHDVDVLARLPNTSVEATYDMTNPRFVTELSVAKTTVISLLDDITSSGN